jgi:hypothetical protein
MQAYALSVAGSSHLQSNLPCQDANAVIEINNTIVMAVCDGLGSKEKSDVGANLAARYVRRACIYNWFNTVEELLAATNKYLMRCARKLKLSDPSKLATTIQVAIVKSNRATFGVLGDGGVVYSIGDDHVAITDNQNYELANQTFHLLSDGFETKWNIVVVDGAVDHVSLFTDGMRFMLLNEHARSAHGPIFDYLVDYAKKNGVKDAVCSILNSPQVISAIDDDRTLATYVRASGALR